MFSHALQAAAALLFGWSALEMYDRMPPEWVCEYGEAPKEIHQNPRVPVRHRRVALIASALFFYISVRLLHWQFEGSWLLMLGGLFLLWVGLQIALADGQFMIIPDQWVVVMAAAGLLLHRSFAALLGGISVALVLVMLNGLCLLITGKDAFGFGDVKLVFAIGTLWGLYMTVQIVLASFFVSGLLFAVLLIVGKLRRGEAKPLGPFLMGVAACHLLFYEQCVDFSHWLVTF